MVSALNPFGLISSYQPVAKLTGLLQSSLTKRVLGVAKLVFGSLACTFKSYYLGVPLLILGLGLVIYERKNFSSPEFLSRFFSFFRRSTPTKEPVKEPSAPLPIDSTVVEPSTKDPEPAVTAKKHSTHHRKHHRKSTDHLPHVTKKHSKQQEATSHDAPETSRTSLDIPVIALPETEHTEPSAQTERTEVAQKKPKKGLSKFLSLNNLRTHKKAAEHT